MVGDFKSVLFLIVSYLNRITIYLKTYIKHKENYSDKIGIYLFSQKIMVFIC